MGLQGRQISMSITDAYLPAIKSMEGGTPPPLEPFAAS